MTDRAGMTDAEFKAFQDNLVRFRGELGEAMGLGRAVTQEELAELSGQRIDTLRSYEAGRRHPGLGPMMALAKAFHRTVEQMVMVNPPPADYSAVRRFNVRFKILGTPPPGFEADLHRFLEKYTPESAQERDRLKREMAVKPKPRTPAPPIAEAKRDLTVRPKPLPPAPPSKRPKRG